MQSSKVLRVVVRDDSDQPIPFACVAIERAPRPQSEVRACCDAEGETAIAIDAAGQYEFACSARGYEDAAVCAMLTDDALSVVTVVLRPDA